MDDLRAAVAVVEEVPIELPDPLDYFIDSPYTIRWTGDGRAGAATSRAPPWLSSTMVAGDSSCAPVTAWD
ncbi:hypothetical protein ACIRD9_23645 [Streptomyces violaceus]|uniref:hypothetical protein n=1 Tax=Streptomyces violaceus TaxID=1936 RepID=UPI00380699BB